ncbi:TetR/AcrR family transcriptional regulator [Deinococcus hopiensis]|uniref:Transcriptional regulator, TetR family n=1 Tax=Deinococcus hopiensis KR-140 TaxID=695939 RepID=A0A1W1UWZ1_9DEIO|nr:TetR/AcrR family transcriptional regulator [Deinococcus hopiensis]SMB85550.1 transcriptional regulator, TetR family [Deinococcus hopiensis KR-140]
MDETGPIGRRERKKLDTWRAIRQTALRLITERGYSNVSLDDIAEAADVSRATLFNYFRSKEAMLFDADPEEQIHWEHFMAGRPADEHPWASLEAFFLDYTGGYEAKLRLQKQLQNEAPTLDQAKQGVSVRLHTFLSTWLQSRLTDQGKNPDEAEFLLGVAFVAMGTAFGRWNATQDFKVFHDLIRSAFHWAGQGLLSS